MGIPHLKRHLRPYATCAELRNRDVIIDGPALAYHILNLCRVGVSSHSPFEQPSYSLLQDTAIAWLDHLETCGISISAIYFDGYLPTSKIKERKSRLAALSRGLRSYYNTYRAGVPAGEPEPRRHVHLFPASLGLASWEQIPVPAFTVPAILDALRESSRYQGLTKLVPGEADAFCALRARSHGGVILTSDSDLLIHELGKGAVAFFSDLESKAVSEDHTVVIEEYTPSLICSRLGIPDGCGLLDLAFALSAKQRPTWERALDGVRSGRRSRRSPENYGRFTEQYLAPETVEHDTIDLLLGSGLDPRVSELVLQTVATSPEPHGTTPRGDRAAAETTQELSVYLPFLLDSPSRTSAWGVSTGTRQLAYSILQLLPGRPNLEVVEFRRLHSVSGGTHIQPSPLTSLESSCLDMAKVLSLIRDATDEQPLIRWASLSVYQDIIISIEQGKTHPLSLQALQWNTNETLDPTSWEIVHLHAQVQGTIYSLRMLQQIMDLVPDRVDPGWLPSFISLRSHLSQLPALDQFPLIDQFVPLLQRISQSGYLRNLTSAFEFPAEIVDQIKVILHPEILRKPVRQQASKKSEPRAGRPPNNPFDVLEAG